MNSFMEKRISRTQLDTTKSYYHKRMIDGKLTQTYVGKFVQTYMMGSGDGMSVHMEFNNFGLIVTVDEDMWGSLLGKELSYFTEI